MGMKEIGIKKFATQTEGIGGKIKEQPEDFVVEEVWDEVVEAKAFRGLEIGDEVSGSGDYTHFTLEKKDWDLNKILKYLGNFCGVSKKRFDYSGTKDKFAITTQRISVWKMPPDRLKAYKGRDVWLYDFELKEKGLELGDHTGNKFQIHIREVNDIKAAKKILPEFEKQINLVPNWFGPQRFGGRLNSHLVGKEILKENLEAAARIYLCSEGDKNMESAKARKWLDENWGEFKEALNVFPDGLRYERSILHHLAVYPNDYANAIRQLPRGIFKIFVHAYQSYLFNQVLSERVKVGLGKIDGDILEEGLPTGPVYGYDCPLAEGKAGEIERKVLENEGLEQEEFRIKPIPEASGKGIRRSLTIGIRDFKYTLDDDSLHLEFILPRGAYATALLLELCKWQNTGKEKN